ncbi:MAG: hypothetical protein IPM98_14105 [Lewinellaceae bacterium]|nr:hypothetical protein [Lewinellaceae bacterium]
MTGAPIASCSGTFFDSGGGTDNYSNNQNLQTTICPDGMGSTQLLLHFDSVLLAPGDTLCILDGSTVFAPLLACANDFPSGQSFQIQASAGNTGGCLTVLFRSDAAGTATGWSASISCASPCVVPAPGNVQIVGMTGGNMTWAWDAVPGSAGFEVSVNGGPWAPASGAQTHTVGGLSPGDLVVIEIRPISAILGCTVESITANKTYVECTLSASTTTLTPATCPGTATGSATIVATGANGIAQFFIVGNPQAFPSGNFVNFFAAGDHLVAVHDAAGCRDTVAFTITQPPPFDIQITVTDAECFADNSGAIQAAASGGTGTLTYVWRRCQGGMNMPGPIAVDLFAGCYVVTVTDANGCTAVAQDTIGEPDKFEFTSMQEPVRCFGGMDGRATIMASGAIPPYTYAWSNGDTGTTADSLKAGFHSVTITDAIGCQAVTLVQVQQPTQLVVTSVPGAAIACFGDSTGTASASTQGGISPYTYLWSGGQTGPTATGLGAGTHTVTATDQNGCTATSSVSLGTPPELIATISGIQGETCAGACDGQLTLNVTGGVPFYAILWNNPGILPGETAPQNLCPGTYQVTATDANGCSKTASADIGAATPLGVQFTATAPVCANDQNGTLTAAATGGAPPYQYLWSTGGTSETIQNLSCGTYTVTITDVAGCTHTATDSLPCPALLLVDSIAVQPVRCFGAANGVLTVFAQGGTGGLSYLWNDPNQQLTASASNLLAGNYTVIVSDGNGCTTSASATVSEPPQISAVLVPTSVTCFGGNDGTVQATAAGGTPPYTYTWNVPQSTPILVGLPAGNYTLTVTDANGCSFSPAAATVSQPGTPLQITAIQTRNACAGAGNGAATATAIGGNGAPFTFEWSNGQTDPAPTNFAAGNYTVTVADSKGCTATQSLNIAEWSSIQVSVATILPTCPGGNDGQAAVNQVSGGTGSGYSYQWSVPGFGDTIYINGLTGGQTFSLTVTDDAGCTVVLSPTLNDQPPIVLTLNTDSIACFGLTTGAVQVSSVQSSRPIAQYRWNTGFIGQNLANLPAGVYTVTATDTQGCTGTGVATVSEPPPLFIELVIQTLICNNDSNGIVQTTVQGGTPGYTYSWNTGASGDKIENLGPGSYAVTVADKNGCTATDSSVLSQPNPPVISVETIHPVCFGNLNGQAQVLISGGVQPYQFSLNGQTFAGSGVFFGLAAGAYSVLVRDGLGCITTTNFTLSQPPPIEVLTDPDITITLGDSVLLTADAFNTAGAGAYTWQGAFPDSIRCANPPECSAVWVFPAYTNTYTAVVTDTNGCQGRAAVRVEVEKPRGTYVPTGFSPNGDGNNDLLVVYGKSKQTRRIKVFRVYDR